MGVVVSVRADWTHDNDKEYLGVRVGDMVVLPQLRNPDSCFSTVLIAYLRIRIG